MTARKIRQGEGPAAAYLRAHEEEAAERDRLERIIAEGDAPAAPLRRKGRSPGTLVGYRSSEDDLRRLRALPCVALGVSGAIPGSDPLQALLDKEDRRLG